MSLSESITFFSWALASSLELVFSLMAVLIFVKSRDKVFGWYSFYCFVIFVYCLTKVPDFIYLSQLVRQWKSSHLYQSFYWYIQIGYHLLYFSFGIRFTNLVNSRPLLYKYVIRYQIVMLAAATIACLFALLAPFDSLMLWFFMYIFMPLHIVLSIYLLIVVIGLRNGSTLFVAGTFCYMLLILLSFSLAYYQQSIGPVRAPAFFYLAITVECCFFSFALGLRIKNIYQERLQYQYKLNAAHQKLQNELENKIESQLMEHQLLLQLKEKQELDIELERLNNQVFRSQMNSHFIFNVLNSIKLFIMENNSQKAIQYLAQFSRFIRRVLDGSINEYLSLKSELELIDLYLQIEKVRVSDSFSYEINIEPGINTELYRLPAMLLQPFVENAVWHGVMKSDEEKHISINIFSYKNGIMIEIEDSGPGINQSHNKRPELKDEHYSYGLQITQRRIAEFNKQKEKAIYFQIRDRGDKTKKGAKVMLFLE